MPGIQPQPAVTEGTERRPGADPGLGPDPGKFNELRVRQVDGALVGQAAHQNRAGRMPASVQTGSSGAVATAEISRSAPAWSQAARSEPRPAHAAPGDEDKGH